MFPEHLPSGNNPRASCVSSPQILAATVRRRLGLQVKEQTSLVREKHKVGREDGSSILIAPAAPQEGPSFTALPLPFPTPKRTTQVAPQQRL